MGSMDMQKPDLDNTPDVDTFSTKGSQHPLSILMQEAYQALTPLGFEIASGPELEDQWHNFDALNVPKDHPARDMQDTFYIKNSPEHVLRTHATSTTARMLKKAADKKLTQAAYVSIGKVFRNEATDATHEMQFFQIDGCMIGEDISLAHMKGVLLELYRHVLGSDVEIEFRPSFFPFTEPSVEVHAKFNGRWLEMMGGGMIHPQVLKNAGYDPEKIRGFAFGGGLDRIAMIKWNIPDVRLFYAGDVRLNQF